MTKRMLIDATHAEETRVVVLDGNRLEDFDVETSAKRQLKGNIYLAKVVRVEPSLQAAFVEYGGGRHGFLAFGEIHPDYYQIPVADRQRLLELQAEEARAEAEAEEAEHAAADTEARESPFAIEPAVPVAAQEAVEEAEARTEMPPVADGSEEIARDDAPGEAGAAQELQEAEPPPQDAALTPGMPEADGSAATRDGAAEEVPVGPAEPAGHPIGRVVLEDQPVKADDGAAPATASDAPHRAQPALIPQEVKFGELAFGEVSFGAAAAALHEAAADQAPLVPDTNRSDTGPGDARPEDDREISVDDTLVTDLPPPETIGGEGDAFEGNGAEEARARRASRFLRNYRIQEVIRRRQILLVQVVKEERGTKGAALTTYISLAGRFCVLMPNSPRGGGISRKITSAADRRRLKEITADLDIPKGMGLIVRTAGANRPKPEIKRDSEYLMRLWDDIREHTLKSVAPTLIYEEASLIKRAIRDVYSRDIDEILVDGEDAWRAAHDFMRMLMPSHAKKVQLWRNGGQPLFSKMGVEAQLDAMLAPTVQLRSGGYLVINQTEALVSIDVNSGRSTRERGIEETALRTNLEAADEVARQLRLRDLAGLIVIDFIDMEAKKHNGMVERRLKEALKSDRARIQVGHISHFGLMEMSRQRLRPSLAETSFVTCPLCGGLGHVRSVESSFVHVLRAIEEEGAKGRASVIMVYVANVIAMYVLNHKRERLREIEQRYSMQVHFSSDETLIPPAIRIDRLRPQLPESERRIAGPVAPVPMVEAPQDAGEDVAEEPDVMPPEEAVGEAAASEAGIEDLGESEHVPAKSGDEAERRRRRRRGARRDGEADVAAGESEGETGAEGGDEGDEEADDTTDAAAATALESGQAADESVEPETDLGVGEQPSIDPADLDEDGLPRARRRGRRGGRRRRRDVSDETAAEEPEGARPVRAYSGPTPADPFGGATYDIFDLMDQGEIPASPPSATTAPQGEGVQASEASPGTPPDLLPIDIPPVPAAASTPATPQQRAEPEPAEPTPAAEPTPSAASQPATETALEPAVGPPIKPIVVGQDPLPQTERKRGWWRR
jgi:ribonuclease E